MNSVNLKTPLFVLTGMLALCGCAMDRWHDDGNRDAQMRDQQSRDQQGQTRCDPDEEHHCRPISR